MCTINICKIGASLDIRGLGVKENLCNSHLRKASYYDKPNYILILIQANQNDKSGHHSYIAFKMFSLLLVDFSFYAVNALALLRWPFFSVVTLRL